MGGSLRLMEWWGGPCKWWCGGVGAVVFASAVDKKYKYRMLSSSIGADGDEVGGWGRSLRLMEWVVHASCGGASAIVVVWWCRCSCGCIGSG